MLDLETAVLATNNPQGVAITQSSLVNVNYGVRTTGTVPLVGMQIIDSNISAYKSAVSLANEVDDFQFIGNTVYCNDATGSFPAIDMLKVSRFIVSGNDYIATVANATAAVRVSNSNGWPGIVATNSIAGPFANGIVLTNQSSLVNVTNNVYGSSVVNQVSNSGASNTIDVIQPWTPTLKFGGASVGITYSAQTGTFIKTGQFCYATFRITLTNKGSSTGAASITGFPFGTPGTASGEIGYYTGMSGSSGLSGYLGGGTFNLTLPGATGISIPTDANFTNSSDLIVTVIYPATP
jgi:hypothetical protein